MLIDELLYRIITTCVVEGVWPEDVQPEINDNRQQIHTTGTNNLSLFKSMSMLLISFKYVCPLFCVIHV